MINIRKIEYINPENNLPSDNNISCCVFAEYSPRQNTKHSRISADSEQPQYHTK
jgi:hypothetical protein